MSDFLKMPTWYEMRDYQSPVWEYMMDIRDEQGQWKPKRAVTVWPRRHGKDLTWLNIVAFHAVLVRPGVYYYYFPEIQHARKAIWDNITGDGKKFMSAFPGFGEADSPHIISSHSQTMTLKVRCYDYDLLIRKNILEQIGESVIQFMGASEADRSVGTNPVGVVFSEYSVAHVDYQRVWNLVRPILAENKGWAAFPFTARGMNHAYQLYTLNKDNPRWFVEHHTYKTALHKGKTILTDEDVQNEIREGMSEELARQEFENDWSAASEGTFFAKEMKELEERGNIAHVPHDPRYPVHTAWDIGHLDPTSIWFFQILPTGQINWIHYYSNTQNGLPHYVEYLREIGRKRGYTYGDHIAPHDIRVTEWGTNVTRFETALNLGLRFRIAPKLSIQEGIAALREMLKMSFFDAEETRDGVEALKHYARQSTGLTDAYGRELYSDKPIPKQVYGHPVDAARQAAVMRDMIYVGNLSENGTMIEMFPSVQKNYDMFS